jgi:hypothetical protein
VVVAVVVAVVLAVSARSVESAKHRLAIAAAGSFWSRRRPAAGMARGGGRSAAQDVEEVADGATAGRAVDYPCHANQAARGVAAESLARFCLMRSVSSCIVGLRAVTWMRSDTREPATFAA